jgi:hypothetical protein
MAYTPINWDELTPINPANLNKMDGEIDSNESRVDGNENKLDDIDSNGDGIVDRADNADRLNGIEESQFVRNDQDNIINGDVSVPNGDLTVQGNTAWHNGNTPFDSSSEGSVKLPNGLWIQWGSTGDIDPGQYTTIYFPDTFPNDCIAVTNSSKGDAEYNMGMRTYAASAFLVYNPAAESRPQDYKYIAIGY